MIDSDLVIRIAELTRKHLEGTISDVEKIELDAFLASNPLYLQRFERRTKQGWLIDRFENIMEGKEKAARHRAGGSYSKVWYMSAAAIIAGVIGLTLFIFHPSRKEIKLTSSIAIKSDNDLAPGGNKAMLTLSDGQQIQLDSSQTGVLAHQGNTLVRKINHSILTYTVSQNAREKPEPSPKGVLSFNTISTPRAGVYQFELPDHSLVFLNNESSLRFPTSFAGKQDRIVELTGEAYFEISKDAADPFQVKVGAKTIQVLGTAFNVKAYSDEPDMETSLLSGSVKLVTAGNEKVLAPGEKATISNGIRSNSISVTKPENFRAELAWRKNDFFFHASTIDEVANALSRWYNVEVLFNGPKPKTLFYGEISRNLKASEVLQVLASSGVHFTIDNRKIVIEP